MKIRPLQFDFVLTICEPKDICGIKEIPEYIKQVKEKTWSGFEGTNAYPPEGSIYFQTGSAILRPADEYREEEIIFEHHHVIDNAKDMLGNDMKPFDVTTLGRVIGDFKIEEGKTYLYASFPGTCSFSALPLAEVL